MRGQVLRIGLAAMFLACGPALAQNLALVVGNADYDDLPDVPGARGALDAAAALQGAGFQVISVADGTARDLARALDSFVTAAPQADRVAVVLQGHLVASAQDTFLLPVDAAAAPGIAAAAREGIALSIVYPMLATHQGRAVVILGAGGATGGAGPFLVFGSRPGNLPNGVTLFTGPAERTSWFAVNALARAGLPLAEAAHRMEGVSAAGYLPADYVFLPAVSAETQPVPQPGADPATELAYWEATRRADTIAAYKAYLDRYPNGPHAAEARKLAEEIRTEPNRPARLVEDALGLSRDQRREIQRALSILGHDPRGVDGIFGQGSRAAILDWQVANGHDRTGYLTRDQIAQLLQQARRRSAELEAEAEARRVEQERRDRGYWEQTGAVGDEAGLRAYLDRYPDGIFADLARERLGAIEAQNRAQAEVQERAVWDEVRRDNSVAAYRRYLERYPTGSFADEARARIAELEAEAAGAGERARAASLEESLDLGRPTRLLIEKRLSDLRLDPGPVDGAFDSATRRALRRWQTAQGLPATGYVDQVTLIRLLAEQFLVPGR